VYWTFMNTLAKRFETKFPGKRLLGLAYAGVASPPPFKLHPSIIVFTNLHISELQADGILNPGGTFDQWMGLTRRYGNHEWGQGSGFLLPRIYTDFFARFIKAIASRDVDGGYQHLEAYPHWALDGLKLYVFGRTLWDPNLDVNAVWTQLTADLFGAGGTAMREYYRALEQAWTFWDNVEGPERKLSAWSTQFPVKMGAMGVEQFRKARTALNQAKAATGGDATATERLALIEKAFRLSELLVEQAVATTAPRTFTTDVMQHFDRAIAPNPMTFFRADATASALRQQVTAAANTVVAGKTVQ
jgi:hypothetical protein